MANVRTIGVGAGLNVTPNHADINAWVTYLATQTPFTQDQVGRVLWASSANELIVSGPQTINTNNLTAFNIILEAGDANGNAGGGFNTNANKLTNALRYNASNGACIRQTAGGTANTGVITASAQHLIVRNLQICFDQTGTVGGSPLAINSDVAIDTCILAFHQPGSDPFFARHINGTPVTFTNVAAYTRNADSDAGGNAGIYSTVAGATLTFTNCTWINVRSQNTGHLAFVCNAANPAIVLTNCAVYGWNGKDLQWGGTVTASYCATNRASGSNTFTGTGHQYSLTGTTEFVSVTNGSEDLRLAASSVKCRDLGTATGAPSVDIVGTTRPS